MLSDFSESASRDLLLKFAFKRYCLDLTLKILRPKYCGQVGQVSGQLYMGVFFTKQKLSGSQDLATKGILIDLLMVKKVISFIYAENTLLN